MRQMEDEKMERFELHENGLNLVFEVTDEREIKFLHFSACPCIPFG